MSKSKGTPPKDEIASRDLDMLYKALGVLPNPDPILRKAGKSMDVYMDLLYDDQVGACIESLEMAVTKKKWDIDENGCTPEALEFAKATLDSWDHDNIMSEAVMARALGMQPFEVMWDVIDGKWVIAELVGKPAKWFRYDAEGNLLLRAKGSYSRFDPVPINKFIVTRHRPSFDNPYGRASLARCFWPVAFKKGGLQFWLKFTEKYGIPFLIGKQPRGSGEDATDKLLDMLENMIQDAVAVIPDDSSVTILESGGKGGSAELFERFVRYNDGAISKALLSQTLTTDSGANSGSYALGKVHDEVRDDVVDGTFKLIKNLYDEALFLQHHFNFDGPAPVIKAREDQEVQNDMAKRDETLKSTGVRFRKSYYVKTYNLDEEDIDIDETQNPPSQQFSHHKGCQCLGCQKVTFAEQIAPSHQQPIDKAITELFSQQGLSELQPIVQPALDLIAGKNTYEEVLEQLAGTWPAMDPGLLAERLERAIFVCELWGRLSDQQNTGDSN